jgi:hypothetical protein
MNQSFQDGVQFAWDSTSIALAETCLRKYFYKMIEGWTSEARSMHLIFGGHYATALEHYYKLIALGASSTDALRSVVKEVLENTWDREKNIPWDSGDPIKNRFNLIRTIIWYVEQFEDEAIEVIKRGDGTPAVEYSFRLPVDNGIILSGHIDRLVNYSNNIYVMDQKTTKQTISPRWFDQFKPDIQMSLYTFAGQVIYNLPVKGVIIDGAQIAVGFTRFERGFTFRAQAELDEWYDTTLGTIERARAATREGKFPMNRMSCFNYGGCEFRNICSRSPEVRKQFLLGEFKQGERWDPLQSR